MVKTTCEACGTSSVKAGYYEIWGHTVCCSCAADYNATAPDYGRIHQKYGKDCDTAKVYRDFTDRWIERRRARAA